VVRVRTVVEREQHHPHLADPIGFATRDHW
jgi:hypothetical protein